MLMMTMVTMVASSLGSLNRRSFRTGSTALRSTRTNIAIPATKTARHTTETSSNPWDGADSST